MDDLAHDSEVVDHGIADFDSVAAALVDFDELPIRALRDREQFGDDHVVGYLARGPEQAAQARVLLGEDFELLQSRVENPSLGTQRLVLGDQFTVRGRPVAEPAAGGSRQADQVAQRRERQRNIGPHDLELVKTVVDDHGRDTERNQE